VASRIRLLVAATLVLVLAAISARADDVPRWSEHLKVFAAIFVHRAGAAIEARFRTAFGTNVTFYSDAKCSIAL
jgi:hypothetical protein